MLQQTKTPLPCPLETPDLASRTLGSTGQIPVTFLNVLNTDVFLIWVSFEGVEQKHGSITPGESVVEHSYEGHVYRARTWDEKLIMEYTVTTEAHSETVLIDICGDMKKGDAPLLFMKGRDEEFAGLIIQNKLDCHPLDDSSKWGCIRKVSEEEQSLRNKSDYGFHAHEVRSRRTVHQVKDDEYVRHRSKMPSFTEAGYLLMEQSNKMKECLTPWWNTKQDFIKQHESVSGWYTNMHVIPMDKLDLDQFPEIRSCIVSEMKQIMQWWTGHLLKHTSTFGMRIYHRESMLINHVDRFDTHLASSVIQVSQDVDPNGGWPLELETENGLHEVYLQPGQMVLYEGGRYFHGRPMRFRGESFGNIFNHFAPLDWSGPYGEQPDWALESIKAREKRSREKQRVDDDRDEL